MHMILTVLLSAVPPSLRDRAALRLILVALRHQLAVLERKRTTAGTHKVKELIRRTSRDNPLWGAPRIHGELLKQGIEISQATVFKVMVRHPRPPLQTWRTFLTNHADGLASIMSLC